MNKYKIIMTLLFGIMIGLIIGILIVTFEDQTKEQPQVIETVKDEEPLEYFQRVDSSKDKNTIKEGFIKIVDFLFYDEPINGIRFSELTYKAKIEILKIAYSLDKKIDEYFPNYKETISDGTKRIYNNIKLKVTEKYLEVTDKICSGNEELCASAKESLNSIKETFGLTYDLLKEISTDGLNKLKEWYKNFKEN